MSEEPPFMYCDVDLFETFIVKDRRKEVNGFVALCTCRSIRAIHIVFVYFLSTDTFIVSLREFVGCRSNVKVIRSENGSDFVGGISKTHSSISGDG